MTKDKLQEANAIQHDIEMINSILSDFAKHRIFTMKLHYNRTFETEIDDMVLVELRRYKKYLEETFNEL